MQNAEWAQVVDTTQRRGDLEDQILEILMGRFPVAELGALAAESEIIADALITQRRGF